MDAEAAQRPAVLLKGGLDVGLVPVPGRCPGGSFVSIQLGRLDTRMDICKQDCWSPFGKLKVRADVLDCRVERKANEIKS